METEVIEQGRLDAAEKRVNEILHAKEYVAQRQRKVRADAGTVKVELRMRPEALREWAGRAAQEEQYELAAALYGALAVKQQP